MTSEAPAAGSYFLSYSRNDEKFALRLAKDLRAQGIAMWIDQLDIRPSEHWDRAIERAVRECRGLAVVLSPRSVASDNVADEISFAIDSGKSVLPVMIERCTLPLRLTRMQVIDATGNYESALQQCLDELKRRDGAPATPPVERPREPLDADQLSLAKERLAPFLGPIATRLVDKSAASASSIGELYGMLSQRIGNEAERSRFLGLGGADASAPSAAKVEPAAGEGPRGDIPPAEIESISKLMTKYIGPVAPVVVKRQSRAAGSLAELRQSLANLIADPRERAEFVRAAESR